MKTTEEKFAKTFAEITLIQRVLLENKIDTHNIAYLPVRPINLRMERTYVESEVNGMRVLSLISSGDD